jgi:hydrogenase/urease accessory protein HupE
MNDYPMLHFLMRWGKLAAACLALAVLAAGLWAALNTGQWLWAVAGVAVAVVGYALAMSYVELIRVIVDMLLPKP